ncbi:alpha/beta fold hydrolase [Planctomyces sp. SH-PL62]|uniref:alpha/beta fold hydrolase n=1 Tax=Planctomyces sp. SH-PL62 TaxID=1636152 RepID=UPI00078E710D|nr:alpha/beta fold hydrolase [Planctomyces sp. SH-PL62]AMV39882.1 Alpha/beta hydrolase family protein [Planctomyces sp. SH-PL62]
MEVSIVVPHAALDVGPGVAQMWYLLTGRVGEDQEFSESSVGVLPPGLRLEAPPIALATQTPLGALPPLTPAAAPIAPGEPLPSPQAPSKTAPAPQAPMSPEIFAAAPAPQAPASPFLVLPKRSILFATNRTVRAATGTPSERFGDDLDATIRRGSCLVNIPIENHVQGSLELPRWFNWNDPTRFFLIDATNILDDQEFRAMLRGGNSRRDVLIYVHGFNTPFDFAVMRLAQIVHDIRFAGVPVAFSWPSHGSVWDYDQDEQNAERSVDDLAAVLKEAIDEQAARPEALRGKVHVIAHSLGNRVTLRALDALDSELPAGERPFGQLILAAPDVSVAEFTQRLPAAHRRSDRTSLYFCPDDNALLASQARHPGEPRAGRGVVPVDGLDNIDARKANTSFLGHGYWADVKQLLIDLQMLINLGWPPNQRVFTLESVAGPPPYWGLR